MTHPMPEINTLLRQLKLSHIIDNLPQRNRDAIAKKLAYPEFLALLLQDEMLGRDNNKFKARISVPVLEVIKHLRTLILILTRKLIASRFKSLHLVGSSRKNHLF